MEKIAQFIDLYFKRNKLPEYFQQRKLKVKHIKQNNIKQQRQQRQQRKYPPRNPRNNNPNSSRK